MPFLLLPKGKTLARSLTVLLPVHNAQETLAATVQEILEVVSELTELFELLIIDNGSKDATSEIAHELTRAYPQIRAVRHGERLTRGELLQTGVQHSAGEFVFVRSETGHAPAEEIAKLWHMLDHPELPPEFVVERSKGSTVGTWSRFSSHHLAHPQGYQVIERRTMTERYGFSQPTRPNYLTRLRDFALGE